MKSHLLAATTCSVLLQSTSLAFAKETITIETFCFDDSFDGSSLQCIEDSRIWATLVDFVTPEFDQNDPDAWPTDVTNYITTNTVTEEDQQRCLELVRANPMWWDTAEEDIFVSCGVRADFVAPWAIAVGEDRWFTVGDPIERGEARDENGEVVMRGVLAQPELLVCGCYARVEGPQ